MRDHVQYHNPTKNPPLTHKDGDFSIYTRKVVKSVANGDRVWVITSSALPRRYLLVEWFTVDEVEENLPRNANKVRGREGQFFRRLVRIDDQPWFPAFLRNQGNFGRGFSPITSRRFVRGLEAAARSGARPVVRRRRATTPGTVDFERTGAAAQGFGDPLANAAVERAAVAFVTRDYERRGWSVRSVESENRGYDLECAHRGVREHVEVKGIQGMTCSFMLTANEHRAATSDAAFVLVAVIDALGDAVSRRFTGSQLLDGCALDPLSFRVRPREE